jgi:hypothetical protein
VECRAIKHHRSSTVGVIHVISGHDYLGIVHTLLTPAEVADYLAFREKLISRWPDDVLSVSETSLVGQYLSGDFEDRPSVEFSGYVKRLECHADKWDMSGIIAKFPDRVMTDNGPTEYYPIVKELSLLKRNELREFKQRFQISLERARADEFALPYRMAVPRTGCGFVVIPITKDLLPQRNIGLTNLTLGHKYDQRLSKWLPAEPKATILTMRLAAVFGTEPALWVNLQAQHDLWVVSQKKPPNVKPLRHAIGGVPGALCRIFLG